jgi:hypothetical protein
MRIEPPTTENRKLRPFERATDASEVLERAAALIEDNGWTRGQYGKLRGDKVCFCALGAVAVASGSSVSFHGRSMLLDSVEDRKAEQTAINFLHAQLTEDYGSNSTARWNDAQRDRRKVIRLLRRASRRAFRRGY